MDTLVTNAPEKDKPDFEIRKPRVLVIENDKDLCDVLEELFKQEQYEYKMFAEATDIVAIVQDFQPDVVLLDYLLPVGNGGELCGQLKRNPMTSDIPVLIYSAFPKVILSLGNYGSDGFISKPFDLNYLVKQIDKFALKYQQIVRS